MKFYENYQIDDSQVKWNEALDGILPKCWIETTPFGRALFKQASTDESTIEKSRTDWSEKVAWELAHLLDLPAARYELATVIDSDREIFGSISIDCSAAPEEKRYPLEALLVDELDRYDFPDDYSIFNTIIALDRARITIPPHHKLPQGIKNGADMFVGIVIFDCLIGNGDRHDRNLEVVVGDKESYLSPIFDNGASLGTNYSINLRNSTSAKDFNNVHNPAFFQDGDKELTLLETVRQAAALRPKAAKIWGHQLTKITSEQIKEIFDRFPDTRISTPAKEFALKLIDYNQQEILEELNFPNLLHGG